MKRVFSTIPFFLGIIAGLYFISFEIIGHSFEYLPAKLGDGRLNLYFLEHCYQFFTGQVDSFWNAPFMYPEPNVITYSDNLLGSAPFYSIFRIFGIDIFTSFQLWFITVAVLNYSTAYLFLKELVKNNFASVLGAFIFAFSIALYSQVTHPQTFPRFAIPLAFLMALRFKNNLDPKYFFLSIFFVVYQIYCGIYLGFMLVIPMGIFLLLIMFNNKQNIRSRLKRKEWLVKMISFLFVNLILILPLFLAYSDKSKNASFQFFLEIFHTIPTFESYFFSQDGSLFWEFLSDIAKDEKGWWDHQIFAGGVATISLILFCLMMIYKRYFEKSDNTITNSSSFFQLFIVGLLSKILFIRIGNYSAYYLVYLLPGFSAMRSITRVINIELIFFAIATAYITSKFLKRNNWRTYAVFVFLLAVLTADNYLSQKVGYKTSKDLASNRVNSLIAVMENFPEGSIVSYEPYKIEELPQYYHVDAMLAAQQTDLITVNGYSATCPYEFGPFWREADADARNNWLIASEAKFDSLFVIKSPLEYKIVQREDIMPNN